MYITPDLPRCILSAGLLFSPLAGIASVDLEGWTSSPWNLTSGNTTFSGSVTDTYFKGGTGVDFVFSNPLSGVDISTPAAPDHSGASASFFGVESSGFGVGENGVGRFDRGESFTFEANHPFSLNAIRWAEYQGDESIHIRWTSGGVEMSDYIDLPTGTFYTTVTFDQIDVDANTPVEITNVSSSSASMSGRLRINRVEVSLIEPVSAPSVGQTHRLQSWANSPWNATSGSSSFSGIITDPDEGAVSFSFQNPRVGIDITDPDDPDFAPSSSSIFGLESTGFGVGETGVGRFDRGESFVIEAGHDFELQSIRWAEYSGDESLHLQWTSGGVNMSSKVDFGAGSFYTETPFAGVYADANTALRLTNVSASGAANNGRLRVNHIDVALLTEGAPPEPNLVGSALMLRDWGMWPWHAEGGDPTMGGTLIAPENGNIPVTFDFTATRGIDVTDPQAPDFTNAYASFFGFEDTGFGVGEANLGRFDRGESFTMEADHDFMIEEIVFREFNGDELLHMTWTSDGVAQEEVFALTVSRTAFEELHIDANTVLTITNVSPSSSPLNGRLRITDIKARLLFDTEPFYDHSGPDGFVQMTGVNLAGAEFGGHAFWQTDPAEWDYYHSKGLNLIRIPFRWERVQSTLHGPVDFTQLDTIMALANARGMKVILDMHNYSTYNGNTIGSSAVPFSAFKDVWRRIADHYKDDPAVYGYGIMNEPTSTNNHWPTAAQEATDGIREVDSTNWVIVGGVNHSGAHSWRTSNGDLDVYDPEGKVMYEAHCYFDNAWPAHSGAYGSFDSENPVHDIGTRRLAPFVLWLQERGARGFIGEYGTPKNDIRWNPILDDFMEYMVANGLSGTYWAGGKNWNDYQLDCSPSNNYTVDAFQMEVLEQYGNLASP